MILENSETIYKSLLKVNQIGKKLSNNSNYILSNGIIMGYSKQEMSDTESNPVSVGFIDNSILKKLDGLGDRIGLLINGTQLYNYSKEYDFDSIEVCKDCIKINFVYFAVDDNSFIDNFKALLLKNNFKQDEIDHAELSNFTSNIDMYDLFLQYKKTYEPVLTKQLITCKCNFAMRENFMYTKVSDIIDMITKSECIYKEDIEREILDIIITSRQPVIRKLKLTNDDKLKVRLMKSLFNPIASKNSASMYVYKYNNEYLLSLQIDVTGVTLFNIYKVLKY